MGEIHEDEKIAMINFVAEFLLSLHWFPNVLLLRGARRRNQPVVNVTLILEFMFIAPPLDPVPTSVHSHLLSAEQPAIL
jgi:hypothetical protein